MAASLRGCSVLSDGEVSFPSSEFWFLTQTPYRPELGTLWSVTVCHSGLEPSLSPQNCHLWMETLFLWVWTYLFWLEAFFFSNMGYPLLLKTSLSVI